MKILLVILIGLSTANAFAYKLNCNVTYRTYPEVTAEITGTTNNEFVFTSFDANKSKIIHSARFVKRNFGFIEVTKKIPTVSGHDHTRAFFQLPLFQISRYSPDGTSIHPYGEYDCR